MEPILIDLAKQSPMAVAIIFVVLQFMKLYQQQKQECHEFQNGIANDYKETTKQAMAVMDRTSDCLSRCAMAHERSEKVWRKYIDNQQFDEQGEPKQNKEK